MGESILTISIAGFLAGFIFSMPIAGPISILITSNALKGRLRYCNLVSIGASIADFAYVFVVFVGSDDSAGDFKLSGTLSTSISGIFIPS